MLNHRWPILLAMIFAAFFLIGCGDHRGTISVLHNKGEVHLKADDGTLEHGEKKDKGPPPVATPVDEEVKSQKLTSSAKGHVGSWNSVSGEAKADIGPSSPGPPADPRRIATAESISSVKGDFELKEENKVILNFTATTIATLSSGGPCTITIAASITPQGGGGAAATLTTTYTIKVDPNDSTGQTLLINGGNPGKMRNEGTSTQTGEAAEVLLKKGKYDVELRATIDSQADSKADVSNSVVLALHK